MKKCSILLVLAILVSLVGAPAMAGAQAETPFVTDFTVIPAAGEQVKLSAFAKEIIEVDGLKFKDLNANGTLDIYEDWRAETADRVEDLLGKMSLAEKVGQLQHAFSGGAFAPPYPIPAEWVYSQEPTITIEGAQYRDFVPLWYEITKHYVTHFCFSASGMPKEQLDVLNAIQGVGEAANLGIPISISTDRPYNTWGSMINMPYYAFGVAHDPELLTKLVSQYAKEMHALGFTTMFHGYGGEIGSWYGDEVNYIAQMAAAETLAYEENGVEAMSKHYIARGGRSSFGSARSEAQLWENYMVGWNAVVNVGHTSAIMMNGGTGLTNTPLYYDSETIGYLRNTLGFDGVLCTDWPLYIGKPSVSGFTNDGQDLSKMTVAQLYTRMLECGVDQFGCLRIVDGLEPKEDPDMFTDQLAWPEALVAAVEDGSCSESLIDTSVRRILRNKFDLGLFEDPYRDYGEALTVLASDAYIAEQFPITSVEDIVLARNDTTNELDERLQVESAVLLKNDNDLLPLKEGGKLYIDSNIAEMKEKDTAAIGAYATAAATMAEADAVIAHVTAKDDAYELIMEDAKAAGKPVILIIEATNTSNEPGAYEVENSAAILMQTYQNTPDHGIGMSGFYRYTYPAITADMLFGKRTPAGSLVFEIGRSADDGVLDWGDLQLDTGTDTQTKLYLAAMIRKDPDMLVPNNLGDVLYTTNFGLTYGQAPDFDINSLVVPKIVTSTEQTSSRGTSIVTSAVPAVQKAGVPFEISFLAENNGADGYFNADVYEGDKLIASKFMALDGGQFRVVTLELALDAGEHEISVCGLTTKIIVE